MTLETATLLFLLALFAAIELAASKRGLKGVVVGFSDGGAMTTLVERRLDVRLSDGRVIRAFVSGCTACMARFKAGDPVLLLPSRRGYIVTVPWLDSRCPSAGATRQDCPAGRDGGLPGEVEGRCHA